MIQPKKVFVIGGVTIDTVHLFNSRKPVISPGGAGLYTALGVRAAQGVVVLFAQRPSPMPEILQPIVNFLDWQGPEIALSALPRLEIAHRGGGKAELLAAEWGAQLELSPDDLPRDLSQYHAVHIAALGPTVNQLKFVNACRERGAARISAGTYGLAAHSDTSKVRELIRTSHYFFMNENEACAVYGSIEQVSPQPDRHIFVTLGAGGAVWCSDGRQVHIPAQETTEVDPTGAGDTFCGASLAVLAAGGEFQEAVEAGVQHASASIARVGPKI